MSITEGIVGGGRIHGDTEYTIPLRTRCELAFKDIITKENLYLAWNDFMRGKRKRPDVNVFALRLVDNIDALFKALVSGVYEHGGYEEYMILDPKKRIIHKASVRDRLVHRLLYNALYPYFDTRFIHDSYSCRVGKGTHKARVRFRQYVNVISKNYTKPCYVLKFDIKKCFENIDTYLLQGILCAHIADESLYLVVKKIIESFECGLPLGNLTSQLFINLYLHELDWYVKHSLGIRYYIRYADDVVIVHRSPSVLRELYKNLAQFLQDELHLTTHKMELRTIYGGVDILGEVFFPAYKRLRRSTERRMRKRGISSVHEN